MVVRSWFGRTRRWDSGFREMLPPMKSSPNSELFFCATDLPTQGNLECIPDI